MEHSPRMMSARGHTWQRVLSMTLQPIRSQEAGAGQSPTKAQAKAAVAAGGETFSDKAFTI